MKTITISLIIIFVSFSVFYILNEFANKVIAERYGEKYVKFKTIRKVWSMLFEK